MKCDCTQNLKWPARRLRSTQVYRVAMLLFLLTGISWQAIAQSGGFTVTGRVTDSSTGEGLPGVTVLLKGTTTAAPTNAEGAYTINLPNGTGTLVYTYIGYVAREEAVNNRTAINVQMGTDAKALQEVVVVGYGTQRAEAVTGSVSSISGDELLEVPTGNITQALQGRLPGVEFAQTSSQPGASMQIRIRGTRSLSGENDPLIVLDGIPFPGSISDINPNDIQSIDILKDASATAIYGSRGANGVILVTTRSGRAGQKAQVNYSSFFGLKSVFSKYPVMNGPELLALREASGTNQFAGRLGEDESADVNTDWQDLLYRTGITTNHNVGVTGGAEKGSYNFSAGYYKDQGVIPTQQFTRYSMRGGLDQGIGDHVRVGFSTNNNYSITEGSQIGLYNILSMSPLASPYNPDGSPRRLIRMPQDDQWVFTRDVLNNIQDQWLSESRGFGSYNTLYGEVQIPGVEGLKYRANLGINYRQNHGGGFTGEGINTPNETTPSTASISNAQTVDWTIENILTYDRTFAGKHNINLVGLYSASENTYNRSRIAARDIPASAFQFYNLGQAAGEITINPDEQHYTRWGLLSYMGRAMYSYDDRYMLSVTVRSDGSSRLAPGSKWHTYPAVSAGWNIARESFMQGVSLVDMLKLRVGYGQTSNQAIAPYSTLGRLSTRPYNFGPDYATGYYVNQLPSPGLGWEFSETWNYGLDFAVLNNRLSGTVEYYSTKTSDILLNVGLPQTSGVDFYTANVGQTQNKGLELSLNGVILDNVNGWTWEAGVNVYGNRNKLVALSSGEDRDENNWWFVGHPINVIYDYERIGLWQANDPYRNILEPNPGNPDATIGMVRVRYTGEYSSDGTPLRAIGPQDRQILDVNPDFLGGFNTRVAYKGFDLSAVGAFQSGGLLNSTLHGSQGYLNLLNGRRNNVSVDYWTPDNTDAKYPNPASLKSNDNPKYASTLGYFDASYLKVRTITLGYNFDNNAWLQNTGIGNLRLYVTAQNPFVMFSPFHKESGLDPETNSFANENAAVTTGVPSRLRTIGTNSPATRNYLIGLNVTF